MGMRISQHMPELIDNLFICIKYIGIHDKGALTLLGFELL